MSGWPTDRAILFARDMSPIGDLLPGETMSRLRTEEINGPHEMRIVTTHVLGEGMRVLTVDGTGKWREHVVYKADEDHAKGNRAIGTYDCIWSLQYDLTGTYAKDHAEPGMGSRCTSARAVECAIDGQGIWTVGTCDVAAVEAGKGCVMIGISGWERLGKVVEAWGGEVDAEIVVDATGVVARRVKLLAHVGSSDATRRFDWGADLKSIKRLPDPGPYYCRVVPLGRGQREYAEDDETEFDWPLDISEKTGGRVYIQDDSAAMTFRTKNSDGTWHYPTKVVKYDEDDPELLLDRANEDLHNHTRPNVSYEADVLQFVAAGMDAHGVSLGDDTECVDFGFNPDAPLAVRGRVMRMEVEELAPEEKTKLTLGGLGQTFIASISALVGSVSNSIARRYGLYESGGSIVYLKTIIDQLNSEINAKGGYVYVTEGDGLLTYDKRVSDPKVGAEATSVVEIKGGSIRIANSKNSDGSWNWKTVFVSGHVAAELITAAHITAGYIGEPTRGSYWDLDNNTLQIATGAQIGSTTAGTLVSDTSTAKTNAAQALSDAADAKKVATNYLTFNPANGLDVGYSGTNAKTRVKGNGIEIFDGNGASEANFNGSGARLGIANKAHVVISVDSGIEMFDKDNTSVLFAGTSGSNSVIRVGKASGSGNVVMSSEGYVDVRNSSTVMAHFGYGDTIDESGQTKVAPYYDIGIRKSGTSAGSWSVAEGNDCTASYACAHAEGLGSSAVAVAAHAEGDGCTARSFASHAEGYECVAGAYDAIPHLMEGTCHAEGNHTQALNSAAHSEGNYTEASGIASHAGGSHTIAQGFAQTAIGRYNVAQGSGGYYDNLFIVGNGTSSSRRNALYLTSEGNLWIAGTLTQNSDRRLKEHRAYLGEDACDFVRALKPALYEKDGARHVGFYAQDVQEAEPEEWDTDTVTAQHTDESLDFDPLTLDHNALIAPLVAYTQQLEKRIDEQQKTINTLIERIEALEGGTR